MTKMKDHIQMDKDLQLNRDRAEYHLYCRRLDEIVIIATDLAKYTNQFKALNPPLWKVLDHIMIWSNIMIIRRYADALCKEAEHLHVLCKNIVRRYK